MRQSVLALGVVLVALTLLACAQQTTPVAEEAVTTEADVAAFEAVVLDTWVTWSATLDAGDVDGLIALWDDNGVQMPPNAPAIHGKPAIREAFSEILLSVDFEEFTINNEEVQVFGDFGFARGSYSFVNAMVEGDPVPFEGKYLTILKRQPDGSWKVYRDCFNSSTPPPPPTSKEV
jgi:ketosteroid isomerase-like protein